MEELYGLFVDVFKKNILYAITYDVATDVKTKMLDSIVEVGYKIVDYDKSTVTNRDIENNQFLYFKIDTSIYLRTKGNDVEPLFLDDENGTHYLMQEGTNSIVIALKVKEIVDMLGISNQTPKSIESEFNNAMVSCINKFKENSLIDGEQLYSLIHYDYFVKNNELSNYKEIVENFDNLLLRESINQERLSIIYQEIKSSESTGSNFIVLCESPNITIKETGETTYMVGYSFDYKLYSSIDGDVKQVGKNNFKADIKELELKYKISAQDVEELNESFKKSFKKVIIGQKEELTVIVKDKDKLFNIAFSNKELSLKSEIIGDGVEMEKLYTDIVNFCNTGAFVKNKADLKSYKSFFIMTELHNNTFKIKYNDKDSKKRIELMLGTNGIYAVDLGTDIVEYLSANKFNVNNFRYIKGADKSKGYLSLDALCKMLDGFAPKVAWTELLGFYDGRKTVQSTVNKLNSTKSSKKEESSESRAIREKYNLPDTVTVITDYTITGVYHGIPELDGTDDVMILMYGVNGALPTFVRKEEILKNPRKYAKYGFKE